MVVLNCNIEKAKQILKIRSILQQKWKATAVGLSMWRRLAASFFCSGTRNPFANFSFLIIN
jgi:hypothetical protein